MGSTISLGSDSYQIAENAGTFTVTVGISPALTTGSADINYEIKGNTATAGSNYTAPLTGTLHFDAGETSKTIPIAILDNVIYDVNRTFFVNLTSASGDVSWETPRNATVTIVENDPAPCIELFNSNLAGWVNVNEGDGVSLTAIKVSNGSGQFIPAGVAVNSSGYVFLADYYNHRIQVFDENGAYVTQFGGLGTEPGKLQFPFGIAINSHGSIYVSDGTNQIKVFNPDNTFAFQFGTGLSAPKGIAFDNSDRVYVADSNNNRIMVYDIGGNFLRSFGYGGYNGAGFNRPSGIALNSSGCVYVTDTNNNLVKVFGAYANNFNFISQFSTDALAVEAPLGIMAHGDNIYVIDSYNGRVVKYDNKNRLTDQWSIRSTSYGTRLYGIALKNAPFDDDCRIFVTDFDLARVYKYGLYGNYLGSWGGPYTALPATATYTTRDGTATSPQNYAYTSGTLTFQPREYSKPTASIQTVYIPAWNPTVSFYVDLSNPVNAMVGTVYPTMTVNILNKDSQHTVQLSPASQLVIEGDNATLYVTMSDILSVPVTVTFTTVNDTAIKGTNFDYTVSTVTLNPGEMSKPFKIQTFDDLIYGSPDRQFTVQLSGVSTLQATLGSRKLATVTIVDRGTTPVIEFNATAYNVSESAGGFAIVNITLSQSYLKAVNVSYIVVDGTAIQNVNYQNNSGNVTFMPGERQKLLQIPIKDDGIFSDPAKFFFVNLTDTNATAYTWGNKSAQVTINEVNYNFIIYLHPGWNLISIPVLNTSLKASNFTSNASLGVSMVAYYNVTASGFTSYYNGAVSWRNMSIVPDVGYFMLCDRESSFYVSGPIIGPHSVTIYRGWNMIGWSSFIQKKASDLLSAGQQFTMVSRYNNSIAGYQSYFAGADASRNFTVKAGEGYFILSNFNTQDITIGGI